MIGRRSVTVVARDGATADSLATAAYVLGPERGLALVEDTPGAAALISESDGNETESIPSRRLGGFLTERPESPREIPATRP